MEGITNLLSSSGYITVNKHLIKIIGLNAAVLLGELCSEYNYWRDNGNLVEGSFYSTRENIRENTGLTEYAQREALDILNEYEIITTIRRGIPATNYYLINFDKLAILFSCAKSNNKTCEIEQQDISKSNLNNNNNKNKKKDISNIKNEGKPFYYNMWPSIVNDLDKYDTTTAIEVVKQSITKGWKKFYDIKDYSKKSTIKSADYEKDVQTNKKDIDELNLVDEEY